MRKFAHESRAILARKKGEVGDNERFCFLCGSLACDTQERGTSEYFYERPPVRHTKPPAFRQAGLIGSATIRRSRPVLHGISLFLTQSRHWSAPRLTSSPARARIATITSQSLGDSSEAARGHQTNCWFTSPVAARRARTAVGDAGHRVSQRSVAGALCAATCCIPSRLERSRLH